MPSFSTVPTTVRRHRVGTVTVARNVTAMKQLLLQGLLVSAMKVYQDFARHNGGVCSHRDGRFVSWHVLRSARPNRANAVFPNPQHGA